MSEELFSQGWLTRSLAQVDVDIKKRPRSEWPRFTGERNQTMVENGWPGVGGENLCDVVGYCAHGEYNCYWPHELSGHLGPDDG